MKISPFMITVDGIIAGFGLGIVFHGDDGHLHRDILGIALILVAIFCLIWDIARNTRK